MITEQDIYFMKLALEEAEQAYKLDEVPIGAIVVNKYGVIAGRGFNNPISSNDPTAHAEVNALREASNFMKNYRLPGCTLYITLEPCIMCYGAIVQARIERLIFGAYDKRSGITSKLDLIKSINLNHYVHITGGLLEKECSSLLQTFFATKREMKKKQR